MHVSILIVLIKCFKHMFVYFHVDQSSTTLVVSIKVLTIISANLGQLQAWLAWFYFTIYHPDGSKRLINGDGLLFGVLLRESKHPTFLKRNSGNPTVAPWPENPGSPRGLWFRLSLQAGLPRLCQAWEIFATLYLMLMSLRTFLVKILALAHLASRSGSNKERLSFAIPGSRWTRNSV